MATNGYWDSDVKGFHKIRYILHCRIRIEKFKRRGSAECFNCYGSHSPGKCDIPPKGDNTEDSLIMNPK